MRCLLPSLILLSFVMGCRSTLQTQPVGGLQAPATTTAKAMPLALGEGFSCALTKKGQVNCLGVDQKTPAVPPGWQLLKAVGTAPVLRHPVARGTVVCAIGVKPASLENRVLCWQPERTRTPTRRDQDAILLSGKMPSPVRSLSLQKNRVCALLADGQVGCGDLSPADPALTIHMVKGLRSIRHIRSGDSYSCAVRGDTGAIFCWGDNSAGQLGLGSSLRFDEEPVAIAGFPGFATQVETGTQHVCAINAAGEVLCWGTNTDEQLGVMGEKFSEPQVVRGLPAKAELLALGARHSCSLLVDGSVWCWGQREALGLDTQGGLIPVRVPLPGASTQLVAGTDRTCAQLASGEFYCWASEPEIFAIPVR